MYYHVGMYNGHQYGLVIVDTTAAPALFNVFFLVE